MLCGHGTGLVPTKSSPARKIKPSLLKCLQDVPQSIRNTSVHGVVLRAWFRKFPDIKQTENRHCLSASGRRRSQQKICTALHPFARPGASHVQRPERFGRRKPKDTDMTTQTLARPTIQPAPLPVLERIFESPVPANDTDATRISLIVRRRERQRRRVAR